MQYAIYAAPRSGTNYLKRLIDLNSTTAVATQNKGLWKHDLWPTTPELRGAQMLTIIKHPHAWLNSMYRFMRFNAKHRDDQMPPWFSTPAKSFEQWLGTSLGPLQLFHSPLDLYKHYILNASQREAIFVRYETLVADPRGALEKAMPSEHWSHAFTGEHRRVLPSGNTILLSKELYARPKDHPCPACPELVQLYNSRGF